MELSEILFGYAILILLVIMSSMSIWLTNNGEFAGHGGGAKDVKGFSIFILVLSLIGLGVHSYWWFSHPSVTAKIRAINALLVAKNVDIPPLK